MFSSATEVLQKYRSPCYADWRGHMKRMYYMYMHIVCSVHTVSHSVMLYMEMFWNCTLWPVHIGCVSFKKSKRIRKWILCFFTKQINPRSLGSSCVKGTQSGFFGPFDIPWSERSWIDLFSKEMHNSFLDLRIQSITLYPTHICVMKWLMPLNSAQYTFKV